MKITVLKSTVESALAPVLKMVSNAKLPADFHPTLTFQSDKQSLSVGCTLPEQQLSVVLPDAVFDEKNTSYDVSLEMFRRLVASASHIIPEKPWTYDHGNRDKRPKSMVSAAVPAPKRRLFPSTETGKRNAVSSLVRGDYGRKRRSPQQSWTLRAS